MKRKKAAYLKTKNNSLVAPKLNTIKYMSIQTTLNYYGKLTAIEYNPALKKWKCLCDCGNYCFITSANLASKATKSCGCIKASLQQRLENKIFGRLIVLKKDIKKSSKKRTYWICLCSCGTEKSIRGDGLINNMVISCGCYNKEIASKYINLTGNTYNYWTVISHNKRNECFCKCKCGTEKIVRVQSLTENISKSCGCFKKETASNNLKLEHRKRKIKRGLDPNIMLSTTREQERKRILPVLKEIKKRDNYTCQLCGATNCSIVSHHIEKVSDNIILFEDMSNLITLCSDCHNKVHQYNFHGPTDSILTQKLKKKIKEKNNV